MTEGFYHKFLGFFINFIVLLVLIFGTLETMLLFLITRDVLLGYAYYAVFFAALGYGGFFFNKYRSFQEELYLFFPKPENITNSAKSLGDSEILEVTANNDELSLKVCKLYSLGCSLSVIDEKLGFSHPEQARRELFRGLKILLKNYEGKP